MGPLETQDPLWGQRLNQDHRAPEETMPQSFMVPAWLLGWWPERPCVFLAVGRPQSWF